MSPLKVGDSTVYKGKSGQWSFVAHRASGILVFFFLLLHIVDVSLINFRGGDLYNDVHELYGNILLRIFEWSTSSPARFVASGCSRRGWSCSRCSPASRDRS